MRAFMLSMLLASAGTPLAAQQLERAADGHFYAEAQVNGVPSGIPLSIPVEQGPNAVTIDAAPGETVRIAKLVSYHSSTGVPAEELAEARGVEREAREQASAT